MDKRSSVRHWAVLVTGIAAAVVGWVALVRLLGEWPVTQQRDWRPGFFVALWIAVGGSSLPLIWFLHRRFGAVVVGDDWQAAKVIVRRAIWATTWVTACAWFQMHSIFNWALALLLLVVLVLFEMLLLTRQES
jgi:hypothetical protein